MKKTLSVLLAAIMVLGLLTCFVSAAEVPNYATAKDGDVLYTVDFRGTDGIYKPWKFRYANKAIDEKTTWTPSADGKSVSVSIASDATAAAWFCGGPIKGLKLGADKKYTIEFTAAFPSGNAGVYFNFPDITETAGYDPTKDASYNSIYGIYGKLTGTSITLSRAAGGKITGDLVSLSSGYTALPADKQVANGTEAKIRYEIDGYFYSVFINDYLYDHVNMKDRTKCPNDEAQNLGFTIYVYNKGLTFTVRDVTIKKGVTYTAAANDPYKAPAAEAVDKINYKDAAYGAKLLDLKFNATTGAYKAHEIQKNASNTTTIPADGSSYKSKIGGTAAAQWYGGSIGGLKVAPGNTYTFTYKVKAGNTTDNPSSYILGIAYNCNASALSTSYRLNWYGTFTNTTDTFKVGGSDTANAANGVKYAYNGSNFSTTGYNSDATLPFNAAPAVDADGFCDVAVELNGWTWTYYVKGADGKYQKLGTADNATLVKDLGTTVDAMAAQDLGFMVYTYNKNVEAEVKDVALYKGVIISDPNGANQNDPAPTGDVMVWVVVVALVSVLGMGIAVKARNN